MSLSLLLLLHSAGLHRQEYEQVSSKWDKAAPPSEGAWYTNKLVVSTFQKRLAGAGTNWVEHLKARYGARRNCISIGCGDGGVEAQMVQAGLCHTMQGIDLSPVRIQRANAAVPLYLHGRLNFSVSNAEKDIRGKDFDMVLFTHSLHHISNLESMARAIKHRIMSNDGVMVLQEYVGPVRWQFSEEVLYLMHQFLFHLTIKYPSHAEMLRKCSKMWDGKQFIPPNAEAVKADDPSETVHSNMIVPVLLNHFHLVEHVPLGGNFFQWLFHGCWARLTDDTGNAMVGDMLEYEMFLVEQNIVISEYVFQVWNNTNYHVQRKSHGR